MFEMVKSSAGLFFQGKLFADTPRALRQLAVGIGTAAALFLILSYGGLPPWAAGVIAGFAGGALQPFLFKDLRYR